MSDLHQPRPAQPQPDPHRGGRLPSCVWRDGAWHSAPAPTPRMVPQPSMDSAELERLLVEFGLVDPPTPPGPHPMPNPQDSHVGNRGDIRKHAALLELIDSVPRCVPIAPQRGILWLDTHAYRLHSRCADPVWWRRDLDDLPEQDAYSAYRHQQHTAGIDRDGGYACSSALARSALNRRAIRHRAVLGESDPATRAVLREQVRVGGWDQASVVDDAATVLSDPAADVDLVIAHIDPFVLDAPLWEQVADACERWTAQGTMVAVGIYAHRRASPDYPWPTALSPLVHVGAVIDDGPHHLAWYGSGPPDDDTRWIDVLAMIGLLPLGWRVPRHDRA
jgi:hypothetical protein